MSVEGQIDGPQPAMTEAQQGLNNFWPKVTEEIRQLTQTDLRQQELPLARIKRIMKLDEDVKMISAEAPVLFSKAAEIFITELTLRAWIHTEDNKRRTLQRNDIAMAITKYDQFDFLIDIVPRDELKPPKSREESSRTGVPADQIAQHYQAVLQQSTANNSSTTAQTTVQQQTSTQPQTIQIVQAGGQVSTVQATGTTASTTQPQQQTAQIIQLQPQQQQAQQAAQQQTAAAAAAGGGIQIIQQIIGSDGQIQQIPVTDVRGDAAANHNSDCTDPGRHAAGAGEFLSATDHSTPAEWRTTSVHHTEPGTAAIVRLFQGHIVLSCR
ncbi:nuclear transcription factor Y subunit gamma-like isoform X3 [Penaeus japonicus]|uniref:nuclear transcription factor Y subunit gamma-like isoform X3 n=1 Tax=Penaeus japonicus TaxID=27405 RepID=UPI001C710F48|nr:nuclear transcription factor Y subunit gamma-like isoform X3 [Penaeus japonicus]